MNKYLILLYCYLYVETDFEVIVFIFQVFWIYVLFYLLGDTASTYFSLALIKLSEYLRLPPNIVGVTLLALGNGAPDLSSIIVGI